MMRKTMMQAGWVQAKREARFLAVMIAAMLALGVWIVNPVLALYDEHIRERPFVTAQVEIVPSPVGKPDVRYVALASVQVSSIWSAWIDLDGRRRCGGTGRAGYGPPPKHPKIWGWEEWLGRDCPVPDRPFSLCVRYASTTTTGVGDISGPFCSATYDPNQPRSEEGE
jgi:hypothetical protein